VTPHPIYAPHSLTVALIKCVAETRITDDLDKVTASQNKLNWQPSAISKINGEDVNTYLQRLSMTMSSLQDPDAIYNQLFYSIPLSFQGGGNLYDVGGWMYGFANDTTAYTFANGTTARFYNYASPMIDFTVIYDGPSLFQEVEVKPSTDVETLIGQKYSKQGSDITKRQSSSPMPGYPNPRIMHSEGGYTAGFFLDNSDIAVLVMTAFTSPNSSSTTFQQEQQYVIEQFLLDCKKNGKKKLIVDVSANGGGAIYSGYDAFKQLFPSIVPYGASRMRQTPLVDYFGTVFSGAGIYNETFQPVYQIQSALDNDLKKYPNWPAMNGPNKFWGDNFLGITRPDMNDPLMTNGFSVSGYLKKQNIAPPVFDASNIVLLYDGACGSTCAIFSELMKTQGGVRSSKFWQYINHVTS
jgi:Peptidase family S41